MIFLPDPLGLVIRLDSIHARYLGGWERFRRDNPHSTTSGQLIWLGADDDMGMATIIQRLERHGLRMMDKDHPGDMVFVQTSASAPDCPWLRMGKVDGTRTALFVGVPDPRWQQQSIHVDWGDRAPFPWVDGDILQLYAAELEGDLAPDSILARTLTRLALQDMVKNDFAILRMRHEDGREASLHANGELLGFDWPYVMKDANLSFRNFTEVITSGWLAASCAEGATPPFQGVTLLEVL